MAIERELRIPCGDASRVAITCSTETCPGESVIDLLTCAVPKKNEPITAQCPLCGGTIQPPVTILLAMLQSIIKKKSQKPAFYFLVKDNRD